jgi:hypothetical protein
VRANTAPEDPPADFGVTVTWPDNAAPPEAAIALGQQPSAATSVVPRAARIAFIAR